MILAFCVHLNKLTLKIVVQNASEGVIYSIADSMSMVVSTALRSASITLYASVSDSAPGNDERRIQELSADRGERKRLDGVAGDPRLLSDRDRWRGRSGLVMPSIA